MKLSGACGLVGLSRLSASGLPTHTSGIGVRAAAPAVPAAEDARRRAAMLRSAGRPALTSIAWWVGEVFWGL